MTKHARFTCTKRFTLDSWLLTEQHARGNQDFALLKIRTMKTVIMEVEKPDTTPAITSYLQNFGLPFPLNQDCINLETLEKKNNK